MMKEVYERRATPAAWPRPETLAALDIDRTTGYKATPFCPKDVHYIESFIPGTDPAAFCPVHSPFGSMGGVMGGSGPEAAPGTGTVPTAPAGGAPNQQQTNGRTATSGGTAGVMGGTGPVPNQPR
jgi:hypothetical protein